MKNCLWNPTLRLGAVRTVEGYEKVVDLEELIAFAKSENELRLGAVRTVEGYEKVVDLEELIAFAKSENSTEMQEFINRTIHEDILLQEDNEDDEDEESIEISMEDLKNIVNELIQNPKFRKDVGLDG